MRRASLILVGALALGGCMRIYPDPELPDIKVTWYDGTCEDGIGDVAIAITGVDDTTEHHELRVPCTAYGATFVNVSRQRFHVTGQLLDTDGSVYNVAESDVDLRNGFNESVDLYFGFFDNFRIAWTFDMGATCASLDASDVTVLFSQNGDVLFGIDNPCELGVATGSVEPGKYSVGVEAYSFGNTVVAVAQQPIPDVMITAVHADLGSVVLTPCGTSCPSP